MRIVILGGGFGGIYAARYLERYLQGHEVILVNRDNYFVYHPMLSEIVGGSVEPLDPISPIRKLLSKTTLYFREIDQIDLEKRQVILSPQFSHAPTPLSYDHLIIALGNVTDFRENLGLHEHAMPFKNLTDALAIRNRIIDAVETAAVETNPELRRRLLTFVIGGGGFSGTEVCAEANDFIRKLCRSRSIDPKEIRVVLVHSKDHLLDREMSQSIGEYAGKLLAKRGVEILFHRKIVTATPEGAILDDGTHIDAKTVIASAPSSPNPLIERLNVPKVKDRIQTNRFLQVEEYENVWALGDCASIPLQDNEFAPPTAQFAVREGKRLAKNLAAYLKGKPMRPFSFKAIGMMGALGHHSAVAELFGKVKFSGFFAWLLWRTVYWIKLPGFSRKFKTMIAWFLNFILPSEAIQLKMSPRSGIMLLHFEPGEIIFNEGDAGDSFYMITEGEVEVFNRKGHLANLKQGEYFGEMALLEQKTRTATVRCVKPANVLVLSQKDFQLLIANFVQLRHDFEHTQSIRKDFLKDH